MSRRLFFLVATAFAPRAVQAQTFLALAAAVAPNVRAGALAEADDAIDQAWHTPTSWTHDPDIWKGQDENEDYCPLPWTAETSEGSPPPKIGELTELLRRTQPDEVIYQFGDSTMRHQVRRLMFSMSRMDLICAQCFAPTQPSFVSHTFRTFRKITSRFSHTHIVYHFVLCDAKGDSRPEL